MWQTKMIFDHLYGYLQNSVYFHLCLLLLLFCTASVHSDERTTGEYDPTLNDRGIGTAVSFANNGCSILTSSHVKPDESICFEISSPIKQLCTISKLNSVEAVYILPFSDFRIVSNSIMHW